MAESSTQKAVSLAGLQRAVDEIKKDFATKDEVGKRIEQAALGGLTFATDSEILALFENKPQEG